MEKVKDEPLTVEYFENEIEVYLKIFQEENGIEDLRSISQSVWNAALMYIKKHVFSDRSKLKISGPLEGYYNNNYQDQRSNMNNSNCNAYDTDIINNICDYYIYICSIYDKEISITGFQNLTGIDDNTLYSWGNSKDLSTSRADIYKKLHKFREESLSNKLISGKQNPVGIIASLNRHYGWASPYTADSNRQKQTLTAAELPKLGQGNEIYVNQIERKD